MNFPFRRHSYQIDTPTASQHQRWVICSKRRYWNTTEFNSHIQSPCYWIRFLITKFCFSARRKLWNAAHPCYYSPWSLARIGVQKTVSNWVLKRDRSIICSPSRVNAQLLYWTNVGWSKRGKRVNNRRRIWKIKREDTPQISGFPVLIVAGFQGREIGDDSP